MEEFKFLVTNFYIIEMSLRLEKSLSQKTLKTLMAINQIFIEL